MTEMVTGNHKVRQKQEVQFLGKIKNRKIDDRLCVPIKLPIYMKQSEGITQCYSFLFYVQKIFYSTSSSHFKIHLYYH